MKYILGLVGIILGIIVIAAVIRYVGGAIDVAEKEFGAKELLRKYEWFKDASAMLDKKIADIRVYERRLEILNDQYKDVKKKDWHRSDIEQYNIWISEVSGIKASYNSLAAEYNSQMTKFNWRFTNAGDLPKGATMVLPREYKPYIEE